MARAPPGFKTRRASESAPGQGEFRQVVEHRGHQADVNTVIAQGDELADVRQHRPDIPAAGGRGPLFQGLDSRGPQVQGHDHPVSPDDLGHRQGVVAGAAAQVQEGDARFERQLLQEPGRLDEVEAAFPGPGGPGFAESRVWHPFPCILVDVAAGFSLRRLNSMLGSTQASSCPPSQGGRPFERDLGRHYRHLISANMTPPVMMMFSSARGINTFQPKSINWS